jgi:hypothetical protein
VPGRLRLARASPNRRDRFTFDFPYEQLGRGTLGPFENTLSSRVCAFLLDSTAVTIAISVKVGEGLVYAADSTSSFFDNSGPKSELIQSFHHARKLIQLGDYPIGILTFGLGTIGSRNLESLVAEFEHTLPPFADGGKYSVETMANNLAAFVGGKYDAVFPPPAPSAPAVATPAIPNAPVVAPATPAAPPTPAPAKPPAPPVAAAIRPSMGIVVGGYSTDQFFPEEYIIAFPDAVVTRTRKGTQDDVGARWWGVVAPISRLILGVDPGLRDWFVSKGLTEAVADSLVSDIRVDFSWTTIFNGMPLQDAIDYGVFLANLAIGHSRFIVGPPVCGGSVDVATITHRGFAWVREKKRSVKGDSVFF